MQWMSAGTIRLVVAFVSAVAVSATGCDKVKELVETRGGASGAGSERNGKIRHKLNPFVRSCENGLHRNVERAWRDYKEWAGTGEELATTNPDEVYGLNSISWEYCLKDLDKSLERPPTLEDLDPKLNALKSSIRELKEIHGKARPYYERENYRDDGCEKASNFHPELVSRFQQLLDDFDKTLGVLEPLRDKLEKQRLERLKQADGKELEYQVVRLMQRSDDLARRVQETDLAKNGRLEHPNIDEYKNALQTYKEAHDAFGDAFDAASDERKERVASDEFAERAEELRQAALEMRRAVESGETFDRSETVVSPMNVSPDGSPGAVLYARNELVTEYNSLR